MTESQGNPDLKWARDQIEEFLKAYPSYQAYARVLKAVLEKASAKYAPLVIVQTRPKSVSGFAEKMFRKKAQGRYTDAVNRVTDLCGGRVIVPSVSEIKAISKFIEEHFEIDRENTVDVSQRLKPAEFGYRAIHYIIKFRKGVFPTKDIDIEIPAEVYGLKAEVQVKTILEHAWGVFTHDRAYKGAFKIPQNWEREMASLAAVLESVDSSFARIQDGLERYAASYGAYMTEAQMRDEIERLKLILEYDADNGELASRAGKIAIALGEWQEAINILKKHVGSGYPPVIKNLGIALCKLYKNEPDGREYRKGQGYLEAAIAANNTDSDAIASLAGTWKGIDDYKARELYQQAFEADPSDAYPLGNYIEYEAVRLQDISIVSALRPVMENAIQRCRDQTRVNMNLPWAFYDIGKFYLLMGMPYESLAAYAKAVQLSAASFMIETSLASLDRLAVFGDKLTGYQWARRLLLLGQAAKFPGNKPTLQLKSLASKKGNPIASPVVIVAGGSDADIEPQIQGYRQVMLDGFRDFKGTVISGGTSHGISGLVGEVGNKYSDDIKTIGYIPRNLTAGIKKDGRYSGIRRTGGKGFSPLELLQYWTDIIASGILPSQVKLLGINGGAISAVEYRVALALGARVAVLSGSEGEAAKLLSDDNWANSKALLRLPADSLTIEEFIGAARTPLGPEVRKTIAQTIHENYRTAKSRSFRMDDPAMESWDKLSDNLKESNLQQADDIMNKLKRIGCTVVKAEGREAAKMTFSNDEIEVMAEMEHARWNVERLLDGWRWSDKRDAAGKTSPYLVGWADLPEDIKEWDRETVRKIPEFLAKVGLEIRRA